MKKPYFSIVIPTLNEEKYLPKLLNDLTNQKLKNFEVIVADSHSEDRTKEVTLSYSSRFSVKFFANSRKNVAFQRNFGAKQAKGDYLIFLDADARVGSAFTANVKDYIDKKKGLFFIPATSPDRDFAQYKTIFNFLNKFVELSQSTDKPFSNGGSMIVEKHFFELIGGFDEKLYISEDHDLVQRAHQKWGIKVKFLPNIKVKFSLRRMKKEGQLKLIYKYLIAAAHHIFQGEIKKKIFEYEMGGQAYETEKKTRLAKRSVEDYLKQIKNGFEKLLEE